MSELRANLARWIDEVQRGHDVVITDRGTPVARIVALDSMSVIERLTIEGVISRPVRPTREVAGDRQRPIPKRPVADLVSEQRR
ncbi:MAG: type II toxin-antitoxin system prevent-host-death family antitoxin [Actinobacteria bacterium]|nr:type II toxin-antitoxin system prevent-host-death family antitoxin [Actinomycetota bacterium]